MSEHTPGPWKANESVVHGTYGQPVRGCAVRLAVAPAGYARHAQVVATLCIRADGANVDEARANARLIAAAPELLEALREIADDDDIENSYVARLARAREIARAALAKAEGRS